MFANLLQLITRRTPAAYEHGFVREVRQVRRTPRNPKIERLIFLFWLLIAAKCWLVIWLVNRYQVPINPLWVNGPTVLFALLCTAVYFGRS